MTDKFRSPLLMIEAEEEEGKTGNDFCHRRLVRATQRVREGKRLGFFCTLELSGKRRRTKEGEKLARGREENKKSWQRTCHSGVFCKNNSP